jgi:peroxin-6
MQHYKLVQQRFSTETMNSDDKMEAKEKEAASLLQMPVQEAPKLNGTAVLTNGHGHHASGHGHHASGHEPESDSEEVPVVQDRKGKGKADVPTRGKKDKGKGKARAG